MFGIFRPKEDRAIDPVAAFLREKFVTPGLLSNSVLSDRYCLGFIQMVGVHVASQSLPKGSGMDAARALFLKALMHVRPDVAPEVAESLSLIRKDDDAFLSGTRDGDLYMGWGMLHLAPEQDGEAALRRFADRARDLTSPTKAQPTSNPPKDSNDLRERGGSKRAVRWTDWKAEEGSKDPDGHAKQRISRTYTFLGIEAPKGSATLTIACDLEASVTPDRQAVSLDRKLCFHLRPFPLPHDADFVMRLTTRDGVQGGEFDVIAAPEGNDGALIAKYRGRNDVATCVTTLLSGRDVVFMLRDEQVSLVTFLLPNNGDFQRLYDETLEKLQQRAILNQMLHENAERQREQRFRPALNIPIMETEDWKVEGDGHEYTLSRTYSSPGATARIICTVKSSPEVNFVVTDLRFQLKPFHLTRKRLLVLGLFTDEPKGALVEVEAIPVPTESKRSLLDVVMLPHRDDAHKLLRAITSGDDLHFAIMEPAIPTDEPFVDDPLDCLARFVFPNDDEFKNLYDSTVENVAECQDATRARQLAERWYRRRSPGRNTE